MAQGFIGCMAGARRRGGGEKGEKKKSEQERYARSRKGSVEKPF